MVFPEIRFVPLQLDKIPQTFWVLAMEAEVVLMLFAVVPLPMRLLLMVMVPPAPLLMPQKLVDKLDEKLPTVTEPIVFF